MDRNDRRNTYVRLTDKGRAAYRDAAEKLDAFFDRIVLRMGVDEILKLVELWNEMADTIAAELNQTSDPSGSDQNTFFTERRNR